MIKKYICSFCGYEFEEKEDCNDQERKCFEHEVLVHLKGDKVCERIILSAVSELNEKYDESFTVENYDFDPYYRDYEGACENEISVSFNVNKGDCEFERVRAIVDIKNDKIDFTEEKVVKLVEKYYIEKCKKSFVGVVEFEHWCGGHGAEDYMIDGMYLKDIMSKIKGKKVEIKVIEN